MPTKRPRSTLRAVIPVSLPAEVGQRIADAADAADESLSAFIRDAAVERANRVLGLAPAEPSRPVPLAAAS